MKRFLLKNNAAASSAKDARSEAESKKPRIEQKYREEYHELWPCFRQSSKSQNHAFCVVCSRDISISHGGQDDCRKHVKTKMHLDYIDVRSSNKTMTSFVKNTEEENSTLKAELLFTSFIIEHNLPLSSSDHAGPLFRKMFPDSKIASKYRCARTKTGAVVGSLASYTQSQIEEALKTSPFSIATDGSTDMNDIKLYPLVVTYFDVNMGRFSTVILNICESTDNTGEGIFRVINSELKKRNIMWDNCVSFSCDNATTMIGQEKGVVSFLKKENSDIKVQGCACHLLHLAAQKACKCLTLVDCEQFMVDIFYYLNKSSKRQNSLRLCQSVFGEAPHKIFKYVSTRWLSFLQCIDRVLAQWEPLKMFFCDTESSENPKLCKIKQQFENPFTKLYLLFLSSILPIFLEVNEYLQLEKPVIHMLHSKLNTLFSDLIVRFVKPTAVPESGNVLHTKFNKRKCQKEDADIVIGAKTRSYMKGMSLDENNVCTFYAEVRNFYVRACQYMKEKFPMQDPFLKHVEVADVQQRKKKTFESVEYLVSQFQKVLSVEDVEKLEEEFSSYQFNSLDDVIDSRADVTWHNISQMEDVCGRKRFAALSKVMLTALLVPQSNAPTERVFSIVRKNKTEFRPNLSTSTLSSLLVQKMKQISSKTVCHQLSFSDKELQNAKKATRQYNLSFQLPSTSKANEKSFVNEALEEEAAEEEGL